MQYIEPVKNGHRKGRNPKYPPKMGLWHNPFIRAVTRRKEELNDRSWSTTLAKAALQGDSRLRELYQDEVRKEGDEQKV